MGNGYKCRRPADHQGTVPDLLVEATWYVSFGHAVKPVAYRLVGTEGRPESPEMRGNDFVLVKRYKVEGRPGFLLPAFVYIILVE